MKQPKLVKTAFSDYLIKRSIGEGGCGFVYEAVNDDGPVAIKILDPNKASRDKVKRFKNEYIFCAKNKHPNIIPVVDHGITESGDPFFVMPLFDHSLRPMIGRLEPNVALEIFKKILDGVEAAHKLKVVHRDLKPENILIRDGGEELVIADFGIARFEEEDLYTVIETKDSSRLANFQYAAPEQRTRGTQIDLGADIYALGLILNELFTSKVAIGTNFKTIKSIYPEYEYLDLLVERMLQQEPASRYQEIDEIKKELIVRGKEYVSRQKLDILNDTVIPTSEINDPIIDDPMKIIDVDWSNGNLKIKLNHPTNQTWIWAFHNIGSHTAILGKGPENFIFSGNEARINAESRQVQQVVDYFKGYSSTANFIYKEKLRRDIEAKEREEIRALEIKIKKEEERIKVLQSIKF